MPTAEYHAHTSSFRDIESRSGEVLATVVPAKDFKRRMVVEIDGAPHMIEQIQVQTPSRAGPPRSTRSRPATSRPRTGSRNPTGEPMRSTNRASSAGRSSILYRDGDEFHFMDSADFTQFSFNADDLRDLVSFMTENMEGVQALVVDDEVIAIELPDTVELPIVEIGPGVRGNSATGRTKPATLSTGPYRPGSRTPRPGSDRPRRYPDRRIPRPGDIASSRLTLSAARIALARLHRVAPAQRLGIG